MSLKGFIRKIACQSNNTVDSLTVEELKKLRALWNTVKYWEQQLKNHQGNQKIKDEYLAAKKNFRKLRHQYHIYNEKEHLIDSFEREAPFESAEQEALAAVEMATHQAQSMALSIPAIPFSILVDSGHASDLAIIPARNAKQKAIALHQEEVFHRQCEKIYEITQYIAIEPMLLQPFSAPDRERQSALTHPKQLEVVLRCALGNPSIFMSALNTDNIDEFNAHEILPLLEILNPPIKQARNKEAIFPDFPVQQYPYTITHVFIALDGDEKPIERMREMIGFSQHEDMLRFLLSRKIELDLDDAADIHLPIHRIFAIVKYRSPVDYVSHRAVLTLMVSEGQKQKFELRLFIIEGGLKAVRSRCEAHQEVLNWGEASPKQKQLMQSQPQFIQESLAPVNIQCTYPDLLKTTSIKLHEAWLNASYRFVLPRTKLTRALDDLCKEYVRFAVQQTSMTQTLNERVDLIVPKYDLTQHQNELDLLLKIENQCEVWLAGETFYLGRTAAVQDLKTFCHLRAKKVIAHMVSCYQENNQHIALPSQSGWPSHQVYDNR